MKASKETKILAILLALFLLIGIGCGVAVATGDSENSAGSMVTIIHGIGIGIDGEGNQYFTGSAYERGYIGIHEDATYAWVAPGSAAE